MQSQRSSSLLGAILSLLGGALVIYGVFFLPLFIGNGGCCADAQVSEWQFMNFNSAGLPVDVLVALPLLSVLLIVVTSAVSFFREFSPGMVALRHIAALVGLIIQGPLGFVGAIFYEFNYTPDLGAGYWLVLLGFMGIMVGTLLTSPRPAWVERCIARVQSRR
jgi:hypothetical protein